MRHRLLRQCRCSVVLGNDFGLDGFRLHGLQSTGDVAMVLAAACQQERLIGRLLDQCVAEDVAAMSHRGKNDPRADQPLQGGRECLYGLSGDRAQQFDIEFTSDYCSQVGQLSGLAAKAVQTR